ncbi:hypothetical protein AS034_16055 [[Bacillus] enclensis]|uniref:Threonine dehydrogenase n=1 Tax=[Bacillus] enclensis TaxID=1402860 RepID=A0A0V8HCZ9_9BACI|nr:alcohol dehydrogenase catalytic domain-containing protein [[Bacillus] enclensis]KSU60356.1 hypothetical protein AS034_16055 [[Bacillus] enclensis]SCC23556.1 Threonine dehydrogenase [[Bacillus] enclensis]
MDVSKVEYRLVNKSHIQKLEKKITAHKKEIVVKVKAVGVCMTDCLNYKYKNNNYFGHELVGEVLTPFSSFKKGDNVVILHRYSCGTCISCKQAQFHLCKNSKNTDTCFSNYLVLDERAASKSFYRIPEGTDNRLSEFAYTDSLACVLHALKKVDLSKTEHILILGNGFMSLLFYYALTLIYKKRAKIVGSNKKKQNLISRSLKIEQLECGQLNEQHFDLCIDTAGQSKLVSQILVYLKPSSSFLCFSGVNSIGELFTLNYLRNNEINITFSKHTNPASINEAISIIDSELLPLKKIITPFQPASKLEGIINKTLQNEIIRGGVLIE